MGKRGPHHSRDKFLFPDFAVEREKLNQTLWYYTWLKDKSIAGEVIVVLG